MQRFTFLMLIAALGVAMGCKQERAELAPVPEPVAVNSYDGSDYGAGNDYYARPQPRPTAEPEPEPIVVAPAANAGRTHTVAKGDTLWSIAQRHYGNGQRWQDIAAANPGVNPNRLLVGQTLTLP